VIPVTRQRTKVKQNKMINKTKHNEVVNWSLTGQSIMTIIYISVIVIAPYMYKFHFSRIKNIEITCISCS